MGLLVIEPWGCQELRKQWGEFVEELNCSIHRCCLSSHSCDRVWGFVSRFPVILSIENHCSIQQQKKMAQYLKEIFGDKLDLSSVSTGDPRQLPSPQDLKGKILVKVTFCWARSECNKISL